MKITRKSGIAERAGSRNGLKHREKTKPGLERESPSDPRGKSEQEWLSVYHGVEQVLRSFSIDCFFC